MNQVRLWKDPAYRRTADAGAMHPSGAMQLDDKDLDTMAGGSSGACVGTIAITVASMYACPSLKGTCVAFTNGCC